MGKLEDCWQIRTENFPNELLVSRPHNTENISVTGASCALKCAHCGGHYLSQMTDLQTIKSRKSIHGSSCLISGGCDKEGKVILTPHLQKLHTLKEDLRYNFHVGLLNEEEIKSIAPLADAVSFDFVGADSTIHDTLKLKKSVSDYVECYRLLRKYCRRVVPHVCVGLHGGEFLGERRALEFLAAEGLDELVFIVLIPTRGTEYAFCTPPPLEEVVDFFEDARLRLPHTPLILGCMRPGGKYRQILDMAAVEIGMNGIVQPVPEAEKRAVKMGLTLKINKECCVLA